MSSRPRPLRMYAVAKPHWLHDTLLHLPFASYFALPMRVHYATQNGWEALLSAHPYRHRSGHSAKQTREVPHQTAGELFMCFQIAFTDFTFHTVTFVFN